MSTYTTLEGKLIAKNKKQLNKAITMGKENLWLDKDGFFLDENDSRISDVSSIEGLSIIIPYYHHRNIFRFVNYCQKIGLKFEGKGFCTDGCFEGYVNKKTIDLDDWAIKHTEKDMPDLDDDFELYIEWQNEITDAFIASLEK